MAVCLSPSFFFFFNDTATTEIYTLSLHDALPIPGIPPYPRRAPPACRSRRYRLRSEEHTSELQSRLHLVCRLLLEKKKKISRCAPIPNKKHPNSSGRYFSTMRREWRPTSSSRPVDGPFFFNDTATTEIYTLSLHDALPSPPHRNPAAARRTGACPTSRRSPPKRLPW